MKNVPEVRIKGFVDEWKECVLQDELSDDIKTNTLARAFLSDSNGDVLNVHYGDVLIKYGSLLNATEDKIPHITGSTTKDYSDYLQEGDIIFADTAEDETAGKCVEVTNVGDKKIVSGLHTIACRPKEQFGEGYLGYYLNSPKYHDLLLPLLQGIKVFSLNKSQLEQTTMFMPQSVSEQQTIGSFFSSFDRLITGHQQRLENLRRVKKSMLQKMFPQQEQTVPEIRFNEFESEWNDVELREVCEINPTTTVPEIFEYVDLESVVGTVMISHRTEEKSTAPSRAQRLASINDIFFQTVRPYQKNNYLFKIDRGNYVFSTGYAQLRTAIDPDFLFTIIQLDLFVEKVLLNCTGTSFPAISPTTLSKIHITIPNSLIEQKQIGSFFTSLDNLINEEVKYIDQLNRVKRTLLQKMFV